MSVMTKCLLGLCGLAVVILAAYSLNEFQSTTEQEFEKADAVEAQESEGPRRRDESLKTTGTVSVEDDAEVEVDPEVVVEDQDGASPVVISGRVIDEDGQPLAAAQVRIKEDIVKRARRFDLAAPTRLRGKTETGDDGRFLAKLSLKPGRYQVEVEFPRHIDHGMAIEVDASRRTETGDIVMKMGASIAGVVRHGGLPVAGVALRAQEENADGDDVFIHIFREGLGMDKSDAVTNERGEFEISGLKPGDWSITAEHDDFMSVRRDALTLSARQSLRGVSIEIESGLEMHGRVIDESGQPVANAAIRFSDSINLLESFRNDFRAGKEVKTDAEGRFSCKGLTTNTKNLNVKARGFRDQNLREVQPGANPVEIILAPAAMIYGLVRDKTTRAPIEGIAIEHSDRFRVARREERSPVLTEDEALEHCPEISDPKGLYACTDVSKNRVSIEASAEGYGKVRSPSLDFENENRLRFDFELEPEAIIRGRVVNADGHGLAKATIEFTSRSQDFDRAEFGGPGRRVQLGDAGNEQRAVCPSPLTADAEGRFSIRGLAPQELDILARSDGYSASESVSLDLESGKTYEIELQVRPAASIVGQVLDGDGAPASGRELFLERITETDESALNFGMAMPNAHEGTDEQGRFTFDSLTPGEYRVRLMPQASGFVSFGDDAESIEQVVSIAAGETKEILLQDSKRARVHGLVRAAGQPVAGATVRISKSGRAFPFGGNTTKTDARGRYELKSVTAGAMTISVTPPGGMIPTKVELEVGIQDRSLDIDLPVGAIEGRIVDAANGKGLPAIQVTAKEVREKKESSSDGGGFMVSFATPDGGDETIQSIFGGGPTLRSEAGGHYRIDYLPDGEYKVEASGGGYGSATSESVIVREGQVVRGVDFVLERGYTLTVNLKTKERSFYSIEVTQTDVTENPRKERKSSSGRATQFPGLQPGAYTVRVRPLMPRGNAEERTQERNVNIKGADETIEIEID